ncbi:MAG: CoA-binding protein [Actinobacteria bacterium]|nr:CoA-binding protein [Actinomycetota bacterium]
MLEEFFAPRSIAVVGASRDPEKVGYAVLENLIGGGFPGALYPVNPKAEEILGRTCYASVSEIPERVDLAVVVVPAAACREVIEECGRVGVRAAVVISAGFREAGPAGQALERELVQSARESGMRILGPNCLGLIATRTKVNASFAPFMPAPGKISFLSQSGALGTAILDWAADEGIGLGHFVSLGNKSDITEVDLVEAWGQDPETGVVVGYLEAVADGRSFVRAVGSLVRRVPFIALTAGSSDAGARAVSSHTGSLAGSRAAYDAAFRKAGVVRAHTVEELFDLAEGFARQPLPRRGGTVIVTNAGGPAILATDACDEYGVELASLSTETTRALQEVLPAAASVYNPVDILGDAPAERYAEALRLVLADPATASAIVILTPQATTEAEAVARAIAEETERSGVTTLAVFMGAASVSAAVVVLKQQGIPEYAFPERAVATLSAMTKYRDFLDRPISPPPEVAIDREVVRAAIDHARQARRTFITESSAQRIAEACGIPSPRSGLARDLGAVRVIAAEVGYPVALKIASPDILHKSDVGGIELDLPDADAAEAAYERIMGRVQQRMPDARIWGVTVQQQLPPGREVIIGANRDPNFGPIVMFGLGGIYVEILKDVTFRLCPVTLVEAREMISEIRAAGLLRGARGAPPADVEAVADVICRVSALVSEFEEITELDINPLVVGDRGQGAVAADVRIGIGG